MNTYQYELVKALSFNRPSATEAEKRAGEILLGEIKAVGGEGVFEPFTVGDAEIHRAAMTVTSPYRQEIDILPYKRSGAFPEGGRELDLIYVEKAKSEDLIGLDDLSGKAVMVNELKIEAYKRLCERNASAVLVITGKYHEKLLGGDYYTKPLRDAFRQYGIIPVYMIGAGDATELLRNGAETVLLEMQETECERESQNVVARIIGTENTKETVVLTAHYDSVPVGTGSWDNATGAATLMYVYRYFLEHKPRRSMTFIWCGSEEIGLQGSKAFIAAHEEETESIKFCFNFDMCGTILGPNLIFTTGGEDLKTFVEQFIKSEGYSADIKATVHSSDSAPFADKGIPAIGLSRGTTTASIHNSHDVMFPIGAKQLKDNGVFAVKMIERVVNSVVLPVPTGMPEDVKKELDRYFHRDVK